MIIPEKIKEMKSWVCYRLAPDKDGGKPRKVPVNPYTGRNAKVNDPSTWSDYETAVNAAATYQYSGVGFVVSKEDGFVVVDIDNCYDPETQSFNNVAADIIGRQETYMEFSPSGRGIHIWYEGQKPEGPCKNSRTGVEMYDSVRFMTVTGNKLPGSTDDIAVAMPDTLPWIHKIFVSKHEPDKDGGTVIKVRLTEEEVLRKAAKAKNGAKFTALIEGRWDEIYSSQSEADMALCMLLAFWTAKDGQKMDRIFRTSALYRDKWDSIHSGTNMTYGQITIKRAIEATEEVYTGIGDVPIVERDGEYCIYIYKDQRYDSLTNFTVKPVEMIKAEDEAQLTCVCVTKSKEEIPMRFLTTDMASLLKFRKMLSGNTISLSWYGKDKELEMLKAYLAELEWKVKYGVKDLGIHEFNGRYVFTAGDNSIDGNGEKVEDVVQLERYVSIKSDMLQAGVLSADDLKAAGNMLLGYNVPQKTIAVLAWAAACFIKEYLRGTGHKFPHLFLIGEAGSGKSTTMERVILPIFRVDKVTAASQVTHFTVMKEASSSNLVPMALDEFKPSKLDKMKISTLYNYFRDSYDGHDGLRGRADQTMAVYKLRAPLVVAGEESADETAIRERTVELLFSKKDINNPDFRKAFSGIERNGDLLGRIGKALLLTALSVSREEAESWYREAVPKFDPELPSRVVNNLACCHCGLRLLQKLCESFGNAWNDVFSIPLDACGGYLQDGVKDYLLDGGTSNRSVVEGTFEVMGRMGLTKGEDYDLTADGTRLYIDINGVYDRYTKYCKDYAVGGEVLRYEQFRKQLKHSELLIKNNAQHKFRGKNHKCYLIDFKLLSARCDVSGFADKGPAQDEIQPLTDRNALDLTVKGNPVTK